MGHLFYRVILGLLGFNVIQCGREHAVHIEAVGLANSIYLFGQSLGTI